MLYIYNIFNCNRFSEKQLIFDYGKGILHKILLLYFLDPKVYLPDEGNIF